MLVVSQPSAGPQKYSLQDERAFKCHITTEVNHCISCGSCWLSCVPIFTFSCLKNHTAADKWGSLSIMCLYTNTIWIKKRGCFYFQLRTIFFKKINVLNKFWNGKNGTHAAIQLRDTDCIWGLSAVEATLTRGTVSSLRHWLPAARRPALQKCRCASLTRGWIKPQIHCFP